MRLITMLLAAISVVYADNTCTSLTAEEIRSMGNNSLFTRWRPQSHFIAPAGWMNDPCGAMYDPHRDEYHLYYQWHPNHYDWGNISWGGAVSKDLVTWTDLGGWKDDEAVALGPKGNGTYNGLGIFSGTAQPVNIQGQKDGTLLAFYTSVSHLPTNWRIPYQPGTETQSLAISTDGGRTWKDYEHNPVINATTGTAPMNWNLTGFRDPFFEALPELDEILRVAEPHYYVVFGSGIKGVGPRMPLWTAPATDLTNWTFLGALWEPGANTSLGPVLSTGSYGYNFEVGGLFPLYDSKGNQHWYVNMGSEGGNVSFHQSPQWSLWNEGKIIRRDNGSAEFVPIAGGVGDWGVGYALTSFNDTKRNRRVQYTWLKEDFTGDNGYFSVPQQGFQGALSLPRELFVHEVDNVKVIESLTYAKSAVVDENGTARTLGVRPLSDVVDALRKDAHYLKYEGREFNETTILAPQSSQQLELKTTIEWVASTGTGAVGLVIAASPDGEESTTIMYSPSNNTILIDRSKSSKIPGFNNATVTGYFEPYVVNGTVETITMDVIVDGSIVEVYVNERFALTARIYPSNACSTGFGVFVDESTKVKLGITEAWVGTRNVWPSRPENSSSELVYDTAEETNGYVWWSGI